MAAVASPQAARQGLIVASFNSNNPLGPRDAGGRFAKGTSSNAARAVIAGVNRNEAKDLQGLVVRAQRQSIKRRGVSTGQLSRALGNEANRFASEEGYGVGVISYLESPASRVGRYYRHIEFGTTGGGVGGGPVPNFIGRNIFGVFRSSAIRRGGKAFGVGPSSGFGAQGDQILVPSLRIARAFKREQAALGNRVAISGVIQNPVAAQNFFGRGWRAHEEGRRGLDLYLRALKRAKVLP